jgi:hypothetical protein
MLSTPLNIIYSHLNTNIFLVLEQPGDLGARRSKPSQGDLLRTGPRRTKRRFEGPERVVLADLLEVIKVHDPDVILCPFADTWFLSWSGGQSAMVWSLHSAALVGSNPLPPSPNGAMERKTTKIGIGTLIPEG